MSKPIRDYYSEIRNKNRLEQERRRNLVYTKIPQIRAIDYEKRQIGIAIIQSTFDKNVDVDKLIDSGKLRTRELDMKRAVLLTDNDLPHDYLDDIYDCALCRDTGFVDTKPCSCYYKTLIKHGGHSSRLSELMEGQNFDTFDFNLYSDLPLNSGHPLHTKSSPSIRAYMKTVVKLLKDFVSNANELGVYIYGETGVGKTFLCSCVARYAVEHRMSVEYYSMNALREVLEVYRFNRREADAEIIRAYERIQDCDFLILDDLGVELSSSFMTSELFTIINNRLATRKKVLISSNIEPSNISQTYEERIASRILGSYSIYLIEGEDLRQL